MNEQKLNYHQQQKEQIKNKPVKEDNSKVYKHYYDILGKQRPKSEKVVIPQEQKRNQQEQNQLVIDKRLFEENERRKREMDKARKNLNSAGMEPVAKNNAIFPQSNGPDWALREKERERLKKMKYNQDLKKQIEENKQIKEKEKQKRKEEEMKFQLKYRQRNEEQDLQNISNGGNQLRLQSINNISYNPSHVPNHNQLYQIDEEPSSLQSSGVSLHNQYMRVPHTQAHFYSKNNNYSDNYFNDNNAFPKSCPQQYLPNRPMTTYNMEYPQNMPMMSDSMQFNHRNVSNYYMNPQMQQQMLQQMKPQMQQQMQQQMQPQMQQHNVIPPTVEGLFHNFVNDQINVISDYEIKVENFDDTHYDKSDVINTLTQEKKVAMEKIKQEQDKISTCLGFYPMQNGYNDKITNLLNMILESKIEKIQQKKLHSSTNNLVSTNNNIPIYPTQPETLTSSVYKSNQSVNPNSNPIPFKSQNMNNNSQINPNPVINNVAYRSKYEGMIKESIINREDMNPDFAQSMVGFSKFVSANNNNISEINNDNNQSSLMKTWKADNDNESNMCLDKKSYLSEIEEEGNKYNIPNSQILMTQSATINNKDNNVSGLGLTNSTKHNPHSNSLVNKDISAILPCQFEFGNGYNDKSNMNFDIINNNDISSIGEIGKFNVSNMNFEDSLINGLKIRKEEKDKTLIFRQPYPKEEESNGNIMFNSYLERDNSNQDNIFKRNQYNNDDDGDIDDQCNISLSSNSKKSKEEKPKNPLNEEEEEDYHFDNEEIPSDYEQDNNKKDKDKDKDNDEEYDEYNKEFETDKDIGKLTPDNNVNLEDYKEIRESQKFETKLNFFDDTENVSSNFKSNNHIVNIEQKDYLKQSEVLDDSYGDDIIKGMARYHRMAMENDK